MDEVNYLHQGGNQRGGQNYRPYNGGNYNNNRPYPNSHPNLSYGNLNSALQPPPGFVVSKGGEVVENATSSKSPLETTNELLKRFMERTEGYMVSSTKRIDKVETAVVEVTSRMGSLEHQMSQIAQAVGNLHQPGQFPSNTIPNPKECKAIYLRSGTSYESPQKPREQPRVEVEKEQPEKEKGEELEVEQPLQPTKVQLDAPIHPKPMEIRVPSPKRCKRRRWMNNFKNSLKCS